MRSIIIVILTAIVAISYAEDRSVRGIIDGSISFVRDSVDEIREVPSAAETVEETVETVEEVVDSET